MEMKRKPFQGVLNIIRFNWHLYLVGLAFPLVIMLLMPHLPGSLRVAAIVLFILAIINLVLPLVISFYIYDYSDLYSLPWLQDLNHQRTLSIHAGFDETSETIKERFPGVLLTSADFYDPLKHTEISIKRARKAFPPTPETISLSTDLLPFQDSSFDIVTAFLSAHEIRDNKERIHFFSELRRVLAPGGRILVTEHLRDLPNLLAYSIGAFHFHSRATWLNTFREAGLSVEQAIKKTPFITTFMLTNNDTSN